MISRTKKKMKTWISNFMRLMQLRQFLPAMEKRCPCKMKNMYKRYGNHMILLDATYKTTKYPLPLFFAVVKTIVNFQVCCVIVLQEDSTEMITKDLKYDKLKVLKQSCLTEVLVILVNSFISKHYKKCI